MNITGRRLNLSGNELLLNHRYNKGTAFSQRERHEFGLTGLLPWRVETLSEQKNRAWLQYCDRASPLEKNLYLNELFATNATLFFSLVADHLAEMLPIIYTPTIGDAVKQFSRNHIRQQGLIISYPDMARIDEMLGRFNNEDYEIVVVTDGEGVLGIGDQGVGGLSISIGKLMVYTLCGGINPFKTLPVQLDVGTDNEELLNDPLYVGWRHPRISGAPYHEFIDLFARAFKKHFPRTLLHWEDFGRDNARPVLDKYRTFHPSFNDDIQGTGAVALAAVLAGISKSGRPAADHRFCIFGAGTAGTGIADQISRALAISEKADEAEIRKRFFLVDRQGLLQETQQDLLYFQKPYARSVADLQGWKVADRSNISLIEVVKNAGPTVLIGCSTQAGAFTDEILHAMYQNTKRPVIMPLSNPTSKAEATPARILASTEGNALLATGSPFGKAVYAGKEVIISQCNNALVFPGIGIGMLISGASSLSDRMLISASEIIAAAGSADSGTNSLLPGFDGILELSRQVGLAVARQAINENLAPMRSDAELAISAAKIFWTPEYCEFIHD